MLHPLHDALTIKYADPDMTCSVDGSNPCDVKSAKYVVPATGLEMSTVYVAASELLVVNINKKAATNMIEANIINLIFNKPLFFIFSPLIFLYMILIK